MKEFKKINYKNENVNVAISIGVKENTESFLIYITGNQYVVDYQKFIENNLKKLNKYYDINAFQALRFHEGIIYGLKYAYEIYCKEQTNAKKFIIKVNKIAGISHSLNHGTAAIVAAKAFWKLINFKPIYDVEYIQEKELFVFPGATTVAPLGDLTPTELRRSRYDLTEEGYQHFLLRYEEIQKLHFTNQPLNA